MPGKTTPPPPLGHPDADPAAPAVAGADELGDRLVAEHERVDLFYHSKCGELDRRLAELFRLLLHRAQDNFRFPPPSAPGDAAA